MKALTIEELKALPINDWVWIIDKRCGNSRYYQTYKKSEYVLQVFGEVYSTFQYDDYGTKWLAYKNKEQAEAKGDIIELPCNIGDPIWVVYRDFDHGFNEYEIYKSICTGFAFENGTKIRIVTAFCCYDFDRVGNYTNKAEAERRLAELRGEKYAKS